MVQHDLRSKLTREYSNIEIPFGGTSAEIRAGEDGNPEVRGWIMVLGYRGNASSNQQLLFGRLDLRYPLRGVASHLVEGFDAGSGGVIFLPWPFVGLTLEDLESEEVHAPKDYPSVATVSFIPVLADDPAPPGLRSRLEGRTLVTVPAKGIEVPLAEGSTEYRVLPATYLPAGKRLTVQEKTGHRVWARYTIDPGEPLASNAALGRAAWNTPPLQRGATIELSHDGRGKQEATIYWRFDLGLLR